MFTTNFARYKRLPSGIEPVAISQGIPRWFRGRRELSLAPSREMLDMSLTNYIAAFDAQLAALDPKQVIETVGSNCALLCWESPGVFCHRRRVAEWLEQSLNIEVPEFGFKRSGFPGYLSLPEKDSAGAKALKRTLESLKS